LANHKDFSRLTTRRSRLGGLYLVEQLVANIEESIIIFRSENLGDESTTLAENLSGQL
jgi:hypothetical protein